MFSLSRSDAINFSTLFISYLLYNAWILPSSGAQILEDNTKHALTVRRLQETEQVPFNRKGFKYYTDKRNMEILYPLSKRYRNVHTESPKNPIDLDFIDILVTKDEGDDRDKRFDDYGHMRFGKRGRDGEEHFDDYGHMRFGRSS